MTREFAEAGPARKTARLFRRYLIYFAALAVAASGAALLLPPRVSRPVLAFIAITGALVALDLGRNFYEEVAKP